MRFRQLNCNFVQRRDVISGAAVTGVQNTFQQLVELFTSQLKLILRSDPSTSPLSRWTKAPALAEILVYFRLSKRNNPVAVNIDLKVSFRQVLINFKCKPLDNGVQKLLVFLNFLRFQQLLQFSVYVQVILNAIPFCPNHPIVL